MLSAVAIPPSSLLRRPLGGLDALALFRSGASRPVAGHTDWRSDGVAFLRIKVPGLIQQLHEQQVRQLPLSERQAVSPNLLVLRDALVPGTPVSPGGRCGDRRACGRCPSLPCPHREPPWRYASLEVCLLRPPVAMTTPHGELG